MEENKSLQYTYGPDEKEILKKLNIVEISVGEYIKTQQRELVAVKYYEEFVVNNKNGVPITLKDVFITIERNENGEMSYHFRWIVENENGEKIIEEKMIVGEDGKLYAIESLKDQLGEDGINLEEIMVENEKVPGRLKGISEKDSPEEIKKLINEQKEENKEPNTEEEQENEINEELKENDQDLQLINVKKIKDENLAERMPGIFKKTTQYAQAYSKTLNKFVMIEKENGVNGKWKLCDNVEPAKPTWKTVISIGENGDKIEKKVPTALMKTTRGDKEIAVTIGQYGIVEVETVDVLPCQERIARGVREDGQGIEGQENGEQKREFNAGGREYAHNIAHNFNNIEDKQRETGETITNPITETDFIPNTDTTWGELMEKTGESLPKLIERYNDELDKSNGKEESKSIIERIIEDYEKAFPTKERSKNKQ